MSNFLFALNATLPLFILIAVGFGLKKIKVLSDGFLNGANKFNFSVTLPVLLFVDLAAADFKESFDLKFVLFCAIATSIIFWGLWGIAKIAYRNHKEYIAEFVQGSYRSSAAVMGLALITNIYGSASMGGLMILGCVPLYNIYAVLVLQMESPTLKNEKGRIKKALIGVCKNPIIIAVFAGFLSSIIGIDYPGIIDTCMGYIARLATPLALITIGGNFSFKAAKESLKPSIIASIIKIVILPVVFTTIAILMGFRNEMLIAIFIMLAAPSTPSGYVMAKQYGHPGAISTNTVVFTTLFSIATLTLYVFILKACAFI